MSQILKAEPKKDLKILLVEVPDDAVNFSIHPSLRLEKKNVIDMFNSTLIYRFVKDHQGYDHLDGYGVQDLSILFCSKGCTEKQAKEVVQVESGFKHKCNPCYKNYNIQGGFEVCTSAINSLSSLIVSAGGSVDKNYAIIKS